MARTTSPTKSYAISLLRFTPFSRTCSTSVSSTAITLGPGKRAWALMAHKPSKWRSDPCSYRPISLLCCLSKVFEAIMTKRLMSWVENTDKLPTEQSRFRKHHSTNDKLFELTQAVCHAQRLSRRVGAIFLDKETFDRVWHNGLRYELLHMNAPALLLRWISSILRDRAVKVRILGHHPGKLRSTMVFPKEALSALFSSFFTCLSFLSFYPTLVDLSLLTIS